MYIQEGLPNATGTLTGFFGAMIKGSTSYGATPIGAFYATGSATMNTGTGGTDKGIGLDLSRSNSVFGGSDTVQPNSLTCRFYIKF